MRTAQEKMQIRAIDNPLQTFAVDLEDYILIVDGFKGPYIKKSKLVIDVSKIKQTEGPGDVDYRKFKKSYVRAEQTKTLRLAGDRMLIKIKACEGSNYCWVRYDWLKEYGLGVGNHLFVDPEDNKKPVYIESYLEEPHGIILPVNVMDDSEE